MFAKVRFFPFAFKSQYIPARSVDIGFHNLKIEVVIEKNAYACFAARKRGEESFVAPFRGPKV